MSEVTLKRLQIWQTVEAGFIGKGDIIHGTFDDEGEAWQRHDALRRQQPGLATPGVLQVRSRFVEVVEPPPPAKEGSVMTEAQDDDGPCQWAEHDWDGPYDIAEAIPGEEGVCWLARDEAKGWQAIVQGAWGPDEYLRPGVRWAVSRPGEALLMEGQTRYVDAAVIDAERYIEELLAADRAEQLLLESGQRGRPVTTAPLQEIILVPSSAVPLAARQEVDRTLTLARARLGLPEVTVNWYTGYAPPGFVYALQPTTVWLSSALAGAAPRQLVEVVGHECSHAFDALRGCSRDPTLLRLGEHRALLFGQELADAIRPAVSTAGLRYDHSRQEKRTMTAIVVNGSPMYFYSGVDSLEDKSAGGLIAAATGATRLADLEGVLTVFRAAEEVGDFTEEEAQEVGEAFERAISRLEADLPESGKSLEGKASGAIEYGRAVPGVRMLQ